MYVTVATGYGPPSKKRVETFNGTPDEIRAQLVSRFEDYGLDQSFLRRPLVAAIGYMASSQYYDVVSMSPELLAEYKQSRRRGPAELSRSDRQLVRQWLTNGTLPPPEVIGRILALGRTDDDLAHREVRYAIVKDAATPLDLVRTSLGDVSPEVRHAARIRLGVPNDDDLVENDAEEYDIK